MLGRLQGFLLNKENSLSSVLANVLLLVTETGELQLSATNLQITFHGIIDVKDQEPGSITVDGKRLNAMVKQLPAEVVEFQTEGEEMLHLRSGRSTMALLATDAREFPELPSTEGLEFYTVQGSVLAKLLERTLFSSSTDEARPNLNGILFTGRGDSILRAVSTDGYRLTVAEREAGAEGSNIPEFEGQIIPRKGAIELAKLVEPYPEVELAINGQNLVVKSSDFTVHIRLLAEMYPPYEDVIPKSNDLIFNLDRQRFLNALKRMNLIGEERLHRVTLDFQGGELLLESSNANLGKVEEHIELQEGSSDAELQVAFSAVYMMDILNVIKGDKVQICLSAAGKVPAIFKDPSWEQDTFVVMPLRS
jgi:DNA polymerase-3 subunit beta